MLLLVFCVGLKIDAKGVAVVLRVFNARAPTGPNWVSGVMPSLSDNQTARLQRSNTRFFHRQLTAECFLVTNGAVLGQKTFVAIGVDERVWNSTSVVA